MAQEEQLIYQYVEMDQSVDLKSLEFNIAFFNAQWKKFGPDTSAKIHTARVGESKSLSINGMVSPKYVLREKRNGCFVFHHYQETASKRPRFICKRVPTRVCSLRVTDVAGPDKFKVQVREKDTLFM